jgi:hypothetical protein
MVFSKIFQGYLVKRTVRGAHYLVVIADLGLDEGWSYDDQGLWEEWSHVGGAQAVDGWYGFANVGELISAVRTGLKQDTPGGSLTR